MTVSDEQFAFIQDIHAFNLKKEFDMSYPLIKLLKNELNLLPNMYVLIDYSLYLYESGKKINKNQLPNISGFIILLALGEKDENLDLTIEQIKQCL